MTRWRRRTRGCSGYWACTPAQLSAEAAASLAGVPRDAAAQLLADLTQSSLLSAARARFTLHDLIRDYGAALADAHDSDADRRAQPCRRMLDHYLTTAATAARLVDPDPSGHRTAGRGLRRAGRRTPHPRAGTRLA